MPEWIVISPWVVGGMPGALRLMMTDVGGSGIGDAVAIFCGLVVAVGIGVAVGFVGVPVGS